RAPGQRPSLPGGLGRLLPGLGIPEADRAVPDGEPPAIRAPGDPARVHVVWRDGVQPNSPDLLPAAGVPDPDRALEAEARQPLAVRMEGEGGHPIRVPSQFLPDRAVGEADQESRDGRMLAGLPRIRIRAADRE